MPQSAEHLAALDALGIRHGLLAVTRCDLADPARRLRTGPAAEIARPAWARWSRRGQRGHRRRAAELRRRAGRLAARCPARPAAPVRLWVDRAFSITGSGTVVTGTLPAGTVRAGQELLLAPSMRRSGSAASSRWASPPPRSAGSPGSRSTCAALPADLPARGMALVDAGRWTLTKVPTPGWPCPAGGAGCRRARGMALVDRAHSGGRRPLDPARRPRLAPLPPRHRVGRMLPAASAT
jgi:selenocysteine-specific elongation factor